MKRIKTITTVLLAAALLTGCSSSEGTGNGGSSSTESSENTSVSEESEQAIELLEGYSDFFVEMTPSDNGSFTDKSQKISVEGVSRLGEPYTAEYYKTEGLPANTIDELNEKLDGFVTEKAKNVFLEMTNNGFFTVAENGDLYMSNNPYGRGLGLGMDKLYLNSVEYPDDNTILITVTSFGSKENWDTDEDIKDTASAKLVMTEDGLRIDEYDPSIIDYFYYYDEITVGNI